MKTDLISVDGAIVEFGDPKIKPDTLLSSNFIYHNINTLEHRPLHSQWAAEIIEMSYGALYGRPAGITRKVIDDEVYALLRANSYPPASTLVSIYVIPTGEDTPRRMITCRKQLIYKGYSVSVGLECTIISYDYPFPQHKTAISLASHTYAMHYAERTGFGAAIAENSAGVMVSMGENPLFAAVGNRILTPAMDDGAADSIERRLGIAMCEDAGFEVYEYPIGVAEMGEFDEIFAITPQGITSIRQVGERMYPHSLAKNLLTYLKKYQ